MSRMRHHASALAGLALGWAIAASAADLVPLKAESFTAGPDTPPAQATPDGGIQFPLRVDGPADRFYWDTAIPAPDAQATAIAIELACDDPTAQPALSLHVRCGNEWQSLSAPLESGERRTLYFQLANFTPEKGTPDWKDANTLRLSVWKGTARRAHLVVYSIRSHADAVAILRGSDRTAPGETALAGLCADRALRLFEKSGLSAASLTDDIEHLDLRRYSLVVLPYNPSLSDAQLDALERHLKRGGRLAVFYHSNTRLAHMLGFKVEAFVGRDEDWTGVSFAGASVPGLPESMPHLTRNLLPVRADEAKAVTMGAWMTAEGMADDRLPASAASPRGFWFSQIPPLAYPSAVQWLLACEAFSDASQTAARDAYRIESARRDVEASALWSASRAPAAEIRAVWALPIPSRIRESTLRELSDRGINTLFEQVATLGDGLPDNGPLQRRIERAVRQAHARGMQLHAWFVALNGESLGGRLPSDRWMRNAAGETIPWLCPLHPDNRAMISAALSKLVQLGVDGIHLDYIRYPEHEGCYCPLHREAYEKKIGRRIEHWPADVRPGGPRAEEYDVFRRTQLTEFVAMETRAVRAQSSGVRLSAAVYPSAESAAENGQDWPAWLRDGLLDFAAPMTYVDDPARYAAMLDHAIQAAPAPGRILAAIGTGSDVSQLDALAAVRQMLIARGRSTAGFVLFRLDSDLLSRALRPASGAPGQTPSGDRATPR